MAATKRMRGLAVHRPILIGSTATPLTPAEKLSADPLHTHKWTVAVRSAASNPLPTHVLDDNAQANNANTASASATSATPTIGTRGRDTETDYHKHVGGKDDISHFVRRVQFKLHDSFPQPVRTCDRPPYQVTETGWGEFEVQIKIFWVTESAEKPLQTFHYLKLHPWNPLPVPAPAADAAAPVAPVAEEAAGAPPAAASATDGDTSMAEPKQEPGEGGAEGAAPAEGQSEQTGEQTTGEQMAGEQPSEPTNDGAAAEEEAQAASAPAPPPAPALPPVVHSWQYDEIVFPEPTEAFYQTLIAHPPTPLPAGPAQAFTDPNTSRLQSGLNRGVSASASASASADPTPPYPLHAPSAQPYTYGLSEASVQAEADRLDIARIEAVRELERERNRLIAAEKELRMVRGRLEPLLSQGEAKRV